MELDETIEFENESTYIDFKAKEYVKENYGDFLKDVIAMANCNYKGSKYIVVGVKLKNDGTRSYIGLDSLTDSATFQKLVSDKIEPELSIEYTPYNFRNVKLGVFKISSNINQPYLIKNQYKKLMPGDSFIRVVTHQRRLSRDDLDRIYQSKFDSNSFEGELTLVFSENRMESLELEGIRDLEFPSDKAISRIHEAIKKRENDLEKEKKDLEDEKKNPFNALINAPKMPRLYGGASYDQRSLEELKMDLKNVKKTYADDDYHYYFEEMAQLLNFSILNDSDKYLEDCSVELTIEKTKHLQISDRIYEKPQENGPLNLRPIPSISHVQMNYPRVEISGKRYVIFEQLGDLKHKIQYDLFKEPLRIIPIHGLKPISITISAKIFGKNLKTPLERTLELIIK